MKVTFLSIIFLLSSLINLTFSQTSVIEVDELSDIEVIYNIESSTVFQRETQQEKPPFMGINIGMVSKEKAAKLGYDNPHGTYVTGVIPNTAAHKAGIQLLDYIYGIDEYRVGEGQHLGEILRKYRAGDQADILVFRKGERKKVSITFGSKDEDYGPARKRDKCEDPFLGITNNYQGDAAGVRINVIKNATSHGMGMQNGDVITHINNYRMVDWKDIDIAINAMAPGEVITVNLMRDGKEMSLNAPIKSYAETKNCSDCDCTSFNPMAPFKDHNREYKREELEDVSDISIVIQPSKISGQESILDGLPTRSGKELTVRQIELEPESRKGAFMLRFYVPTSGKTVVRVANNSGRIIYEYDLGIFSGDFEDGINLNTPGTFQLLVMQGTQVASRKIRVE